MIQAIPRRQIEDLKLLYKLHPQRNDIYVEGRFDRDVYEHFAQKHNLLKHAFYDADSFEVSDDLLKKHGLSRGRKQHLQVLARELAISAAEAKLKCIIDRDLDHWFVDLEKNPLLCWTHYSDVECYYLDSETIHDILTRCAKASIKDWDAFYDSFIVVLKSLYAMRLTSKDMKLNISWINPDKMLKKDGGNIRFNDDEYIKRLMLNNSHGAALQDFIKIYKKWIALLNKDIRLCVRGHDILTLLAWTSTKFNGNSFNTEALTGILILLAPTREQFKELLT